MDNATVVEALKTRFADAIQNVVEFRKQLIIWLAPQRLVEVCQFLRDEPSLRYNFLSDVSCVDRLEMQAEGIPSGEKDPLYDQAVEIVLRTRRPSISLVQRHLRIGYNRAARLIEDMERAGMVSAMQSNGNREVLVPAKAE